ncbi:DUF5694 domain-containing protein [Robiginitalea sp. IMCC44478]|uniref:DUF5694 domain-containing protein n=1 Tax=Robiginitalea sp. IMCC44478 TaxID=3459122 RepID=UPI00404173A6
MLVLVLSGCREEASPLTESKVKSIEDYFPRDRAEVLVVGSFHFDYPGLDAMQTLEEDKIDVLREPKKSEVTELVDYLKKFRPNKIAIEAFPDWGAVAKLREYKNGKHREKRDERYQLAIRLAAELEMDTIYSIDAQGLLNDLYEMDTTYFDALGKAYDFRSDGLYDSLYTKWYEDDSRKVSQMPLIDYFSEMNSRRSHKYDYGFYLTGDFKLGDYRGADMLSLYWYNRNLRIFRNIQRITTSPKDRIMVIFGNGHAAILRQLLEMSPEFHFVEFDSLKE